MLQIPLPYARFRGLKGKSHAGLAFEQLLLKRFLFGDVDDRPEVFDDDSGGIPAGLPPRKQPEHRAIRPRDPVFEGNFPPFSRSGLHREAGWIPVLGMDRFRPYGKRRLTGVRLKSIKGPYLIRPGIASGKEIPLPDSGLRRSQSLFEPAPVFGQFNLGKLAFGDVGNEADVLDHLSGSITFRRSLGLEPVQGTITRIRHPELHRGLPAALHRIPDHMAYKRAVRLMHRRHTKLMGQCLGSGRKAVQPPYLFRPQQFIGFDIPLPDARTCSSERKREARLVVQQLFFQFFLCGDVNRDPDITLYRSPAVVIGSAAAHDPARTPLVQKKAILDMHIHARGAAGCKGLHGRNAVRRVEPLLPYRQ